MRQEAQGARRTREQSAAAAAEQKSREQLRAESSLRAESGREQQSKLLMSREPESPCPCLSLAWGVFFLELWRAQLPCPDIVWPCTGSGFSVSSAGGAPRISDFRSRRAFFLCVHGRHDDTHQSQPCRAGQWCTGNLSSTRLACCDELGGRL
jgi:hypothetical protein